MPETLEERYLEAAPYIQRAVEDHGEDWVLEQYSERLYPLERLKAMPEEDELPFFDRMMTERAPALRVVA